MLNSYNFIFVILLTVHSDIASIDKISFTFLSEETELVFNNSMIVKVSGKGNPDELRQFYNQIKKTDHETFLNSLKEVKNHFRLNDWLYYCLVKKACMILFENKSKNYQQLMVWFFMGESGYRMQVCFRDSNIYIFYYSSSVIYGKHSIGHSYCLDCEGDRNDYTRYAYNPYKTGRNLDFRFSFLPTLNNEEIVIKNFKNNFNTNLKVSLSKTLIDEYRSFINISLSEIFKTPISTVAYNSLVQPLKDSLKKLEVKEAVNYLVMFTREFSVYSSDSILFSKREKWMVPEEVLYYGAGDCEDKSSLLSYLVKEVLDVPIIIIEYPELKHVNIGVSYVDKIIEPNIYYEGKPYYICEPSIREGHTINSRIYENKKRIITRFN